MPFALRYRSELAVAVLGTAVLGYLVVRLGYGPTAFRYASILLFAAACAYLAWNTHPAWTLSFGLVLSTVSGNWGHVGVPSYLAPDRLFIAAAVVTLMFRGPAVADRPAVRPALVHWVLLTFSAYAIVSAAVSHTLFDRDAFFKLAEAAGILPFLVFLLAPTAFRGPRERNVLLVGLVALGGYLGVTAVFESVGGLHGLVWPSFINDPNVGILLGHARGPFTQPTTDGTALFACGVAGAIALYLWRSTWARVGAAAVVALSVAGMLFTLERAVWVAGAAGLILTMLATRRLRRYVVPSVLIAALVVSTALVAVPGLRGKASGRLSNQQTLWDRKNLNRAALNMIEARPLLGFGWFTFTKASTPYFEQGNYPLTATKNQEPHNIVFWYGANLGLIGAFLWVLAVLLAIAGGLTVRGPPDLEPWRLGFMAYAVSFGVVSSFVPPNVFPNLMFWLLAGVVWAGRVGAEPEPSPVSAGDR